MQQDYGHCLNFADGDIFRHILNARGRGDLVCEKKWYARLKRWQKGHLTTVQHYHNGALLRVFFGAQCQHGPRLARVQLLQTTRNYADAL